jgi:acetylornithine/succinyldiaminopimelate/putrescine aminotransferase
MTNAEVMARSAAHEVGVYARQPVALVRGRGAEVWDADGKRYVDFFAGLSVSNVGHCHPAVVEAVRAQTASLFHTSNVYHSVPASELTALLCRHSFAERGGGRYEILATVGSFHGRTFATLTATGQEKYHTGFLPLLPGIRLVPYDDLPAMAGAVRDETVAIIVEPPRTSTPPPRRKTARGRRRSPAAYRSAPWAPGSASPRSSGRGATAPPSAATRS